jgi:hypothetical protein
LEHLGVSAHQPLETRNFQKSGWVGHMEPGIHTHFQRGLTWLPYPAIMPPNYLKLVRGYKLDHLLFQT